MATKEKEVGKKGGVSLEYVETGLVKFFLTSKSEVLENIPFIERPEQKILDEKHVDEAKKARIEARQLKRGAVRPGHVDTGFPAYVNEAGVTLPTFAEGMLRGSYGFRDVHYFEQYKGKKLYVVVFAFEYGLPNAENLEELQKMFAAYAANSWTVNVWDNPNLTTTVNATNRVTGVRAPRKLVAGTKRIFIP